MSERLRPEHTNARSADGPPNDDNTLDQTRDAGHQFLRAADDAISRALSGDSERFISASRQRGGQ